MGTIKQDRKDLEMLLNGVDPVADMSPVLTTTPHGKPQAAQQVIQPPKVQATVDNTTDTSFAVEKLFDFDYESLKKSLRKKARKTVVNIAKHILQEELLEEEYIKDKIEQDVDTFTDLYMQVESNNIMQRSILDTVSRGNTMPRMYEVFAQLTDKIQAVNKQIVATEQQVRKTYLDLKFEIKDKESEMMDQNQQKQLTTASHPEDQSKIITSSTQLIQMAKKAHRDKILEAKETKYVEEQ